MVDDLEPGPDPRKVRNPRSRKPDPPARAAHARRSYEENRSFSIKRDTEAGALAVKAEVTAAVYYLNRWEVDPKTGEKYDVRVRPYVTEHWKLGATEWTFDKGTRKVPRGWYDGDSHFTESGFHTDSVFKALLRQNPAATHYWKATFCVRAPMRRGFRQMDKDALEQVHRKSAEARGITIAQGSGSGERRGHPGQDHAEGTKPPAVASPSDVDRVAARLADPRCRRRTVEERADLRRPAHPACALISNVTPSQS